MEKNKRKENYISLGILLFLFLVGVGVGIGFYLDDKLELWAEEAREDPYYTKYHLTEYEMDILRMYFAVSSEPFYLTERDEKEGPDFSYVEIVPTEKTEKYIDLVNYYLFDSLYESDIKGKEYAEECGLSYGNRITMDWFVAHLEDAVQIIDRSPFLRQRLEGGDRKWVTYDMISGDSSYTSFQLSRVELRSLNRWFQIETVQDLSELDKQFEEGRRDFTDVELEGTEYTKKAAFAMSWLLFENSAPEDEQAMLKAQEYGLSKENPVTVDWMIEHPKETMEIKNAMENYGEIFYYPDKVRKIYEYYEVTVERGMKKLFGGFIK